MNTCVNPANDSTSISSESKELVLNVESLTVSALARVSYGVDAVGKDLRIVIVNGSNGRNGRG